MNMKIKTLTADLLFPMVKEGKIEYHQIFSLDPKKFEDLEHTMRMIFNHEDGQQVTQRGIIAAAQHKLKIQNQMEEAEREKRDERREASRRAPKKLVGDKRSRPRPQDSEREDSVSEDESEDDSSVSEIYGDGQDQHGT